MSNFFNLRRHKGYQEVAKDTDDTTGRSRALALPRPVQLKKHIDYTEILDTFLAICFSVLSCSLYFWALLGAPSFFQGLPPKKQNHNPGFFAVLFMGAFVALPLIYYNYVGIRREFAQAKESSKGKAKQTLSRQGTAKVTWMASLKALGAGTSFFMIIHTLLPIIPWVGSLAIVFVFAAGAFRAQYAIYKNGELAKEREKKLAKESGKAVPQASSPKRRLIRFLASGFSLNNTVTNFLAFCSLPCVFGASHSLSFAHPDSEEWAGLSVIILAMLSMAERNYKGQHARLTKFSEEKVTPQCNPKDMGAVYTALVKTAATIVSLLLISEKLFHVGMWMSIAIGGPLAAAGMMGMAACEFYMLFATRKSAQAALPAPAAQPTQPALPSVNPLALSAPVTVSFAR